MSQGLDMEQDSFDPEDRCHAAICIVLGVHVCACERLCAFMHVHSHDCVHEYDVNELNENFSFDIMVLFTI